MLLGVIERRGPFEKIYELKCDWPYLFGHVEQFSWVEFLVGALSGIVSRIDKGKNSGKYYIFFT